MGKTTLLLHFADVKIVISGRQYVMNPTAREKVAQHVTDQVFFKPCVIRFFTVSNVTFVITNAVIPFLLSLSYK